MKATPTASLEKRTLMNAIERLNKTVQSFKELKVLSNKLVDKFERNEDAKCHEELNKPEPDIDRHDIIELFYNINSQLNVLLNEIGDNVSKVVEQID